ILQYRERMPAQIGRHAIDRRDAHVTGRCYDMYERHFFRHDPLQAMAGALLEQPRLATGVTALHHRCEDIPDATWREQVFERTHLTGRLSFLYSPVQGLAIAVNFFRDQSSGGFTDQEITDFSELAPM